MVYKAIETGETASYISDLFKIHQSATNTRSSSQRKIQVQRLQTVQFGSHSLTAIATKNWNKLPANLTTCTLSTQIFRYLLEAHFDSKDNA